MFIVYLFFIGILICLVVGLVSTFIYENKRVEKYQQSISFHKHHNLIRELDPELANMTLDEYTDYRLNHQGQFASWGWSLTPLSPSDLFGLKMEYYWDCKNDLYQYATEILLLWDEFFNLIHTSSYENYKSDLLFLAKLTRLSKISSNKRDELDTKLLNFIDSNYPTGTDNDFKNRLKYLLNWADFRINRGYLDLMLLGITIREVENLKHLWNNNESDFMKLKSENPSLAKGFYYFVRTCFERFLDKEGMKYRFWFLYKEVSIWVMEIFKNEENTKDYSDVFITYRRVARLKKKGIHLFWDYFLDYTTGYGEKPHLLLYYFVGSILLFTVIYYPYPLSPIIIEGINKDDPWFTSLINVLYFNFTTMISNLYGNISPGNEIAKILVIIQQTLGFALSGSFIALFLRKVFQD